MGKGSRHMTWRIKPGLFEAIVAAVNRANRHSTVRGPAEPYTVRTWIMKAVTDKLGHLDRAAKQRRTGSRRPKGRRASVCAEVVASAGVAKNPTVGEPILNAA